MSDHYAVMQLIQKLPGVSYPVLVPNLAGLENAIASSNVNEIAIFCAASEGFSKKNTNCSIKESMERMKEVSFKAIKNGLKVIGCPYDGPTPAKTVVDMAVKLLEFGCYEVSLGDTIGVGNAGSVKKLLDEILQIIPSEKLAVHFHDTYGQALSNVLTSIENGIRVADSSIAGLGGCPYAKGASGNLATEDLGINIEKLVETSDWICKRMGRRNESHVATALLSKYNKS